MNRHWTEKSIKDFLFRIAADFIAQLEDKMESENISQDELAEKLTLTKGRVSQVLNHPGNITLNNIVKYARTLGMKVSIVAYEDDDTENRRGPINSEVFKICWEKSGKPSDFWSFQEINKNQQAAANITSNPIYISTDSFYFPISQTRMTGQNLDVVSKYRMKKVGLIAESTQDREQLLDVQKEMQNG
ncbi:MAG: helix-turn-helix transcriptional regulator [bacterium]|mgnify:CR=1 FL=1